MCCCLLVQVNQMRLHIPTHLVCSKATCYSNMVIIAAMCRQLLYVRLNQVWLHIAGHSVWCDADDDLMCCNASMRR
jgi:hypothetical protein